MKPLQTYLAGWPDYAYNLALIGVAIVAGLVLRLLLHLVSRFYAARQTGFSILKSLILRTGPVLNHLLPLFLLNLAVPMMRMEGSYKVVFGRIVVILLIISFARLLVSLVHVTEDYVYHRFNISKADNLRERKVRTQLQFVKKLVMTVILVFTICGILMTFESLRRVGAGLLTGLGIGGIIVGFAAQKSLGNFLAGFQIAFTQPLRIDDVITVENEFGRVEEITMTYLVLRLWDDRRLVLPITYLIERPFVNWTRTGSQLLGTVSLYLDYTAPIDAIREEFNRLTDASPYWDKRARAIEITNATERVIEVRALVSANNSGDMWNLRCYVREQLVHFIKTHHPYCLPVSRAVMQDSATPGGAASLA